MENLSLFFSPEKLTIKSNWNIYRKGESKIATVYPLVTKNRLDNAFEKNTGTCASWIRYSVKSSYITTPRNSK